MALVDTHVAMALGASVHPFTSTTPSVKTVDINNMGLSSIWFKNSIIDILHRLSRNVIAKKIENANY